MVAEITALLIWTSVGDAPSGAGDVTDTDVGNSEKEVTCVVD